MLIIKFSANLHHFQSRDQVEHEIFVLRLFCVQVFIEFLFLTEENHVKVY